MTMTLQPRRKSASAEQPMSAPARRLHIRRASRVEPDQQGRWWADLSPVSGPVLGPFDRRSEALEAELRWLEEATV